MIKSTLYLNGHRLHPNEFVGRAGKTRFNLKLVKGDRILELRTFLGFDYFCKSYTVQQSVVPRAPWRPHVEENESEY